MKSQRFVFEGKLTNSLRFYPSDHEAIKKGLTILEKEAAKESRSSAKSCLAKFCYKNYFDWMHGGTRAGLSWAYQSAEQGDATGMLILAHAFAEGNGVRKDPIECIKWLLLAERDRPYLGISRMVEKNPHVNSIFCELKKEASEKAESWARNHPGAFFTPPD